MGEVVTTRAGQFDPVDEATSARWHRFGARGDVNFAALLGLVVEEVRHGWCRMRLPFRPDLKHAGGIVHGGALATLLDSVLVPAIGVTLPAGSQFSTIDLHVQYLDVLVDEDAVAEGWIVRQGSRNVFGESEVRAANTHRLLAKATAIFTVRRPNDT